MKPIPLSPPVKVKYKILPSVSKHLWPLIDIQLGYKGAILPYKALALIDSGANASVIRPELAEVLGVNTQQGKTIKGRGVGSSYKGVLLPDDIDVGAYGYQFNFRFTTIRGVIWDCILGQDSIFQVARIDFYKFRGYFELRFRQDIN